MNQAYLKLYKAARVWSIIGKRSTGGDVVTDHQQLPFSISP
jgi:hypothetical protein